MKEEFPQNAPLNRPRKGFKELPEDHWFDLNRIKEKFGGEKPSPMKIRANVLLKLAGIPSGQYSVLKTENNAEGEVARTDPKGDEVVAEYITNKAGLVVPDTKGIATIDVRDRYPNGLPEEVLSHLDEKNKKMIEAMYEYDKYARENFSGTQHALKAQRPINLHFLPGGILAVLVGYTHRKEWQERYGHYMKEIGKGAEVVAIEGFFNVPMGQSLNMIWSHSRERNADYGVLMKDLVDEGYSGIFTEVDGRDESRVSLEPTESFFGMRFLRDLPDSFYEKYLAYLKREDPGFGADIATEKKLKKFLTAQSTYSDVGVWRRHRTRSSRTYQEGKRYHSHQSLSDTGEAALSFTGNELGQMIYTDALAAIKLHLLGKMMNDGRIPKGAIVDYEGAEHLSSKSFFLQYPEYAMEIVLRTIPELLAGTAESRIWNDESAELHAEKVFDHTNWEQAIKEIFRIPFKKVADARPGADSTESGEKQRPMTEAHPDSYVLDTILASQKDGAQHIEDWARKMEELIQKFAF